MARGEKLGMDAYQGVRRAFAISEKMVKEAGLPGIHWQIMWSSTAYDPVVTFGMRGVGVSSSISYGLVGAARILAPKVAAKAEGLTYDMVMEAMPKLWTTKAVQQELPWWLPLPTGWDTRPRLFASPRTIVMRDRTPEKFAAICREARTFCEKNGLRHIIIHPINEWQEGSYIEPNEEYGFAMYDAIRDAFCDKPVAGWPKNLRPSDVGLGPYDYPPLFRSSVQHWDFTDSTEGWYRQPYGAAEVMAKDGCLDFLITMLHNFSIRQRVMPFDTAKYAKFRIRMKITPNAKAGLGDVENPDMRLKWGTGDHPIIGPGLVVDEERCIASCPVSCDGEFHEYTLDLSANPDWKGMVDELWFEACQVMHSRVTIDWMRFE